MEIILDGRTVDSRETLHQRLTELLQLPVVVRKKSGCAA